MTLLLGITTTRTSNAQNKQYRNISVKPHLGTILQTNDFVGGDNQKKEELTNYSAFEAQLLWQTPDTTDWHYLYRLPYYGFGISVHNFYNKTEIGVPFSGFGVLGIPIVLKDKFELYNELQFGGTYGWKIYDSITNPANNTMGSRFTAHMSFGFTASYKLNEKLNLGIGLQYIHFSNGNTKRPNKGMNVISSSFDLKYKLNGNPPYQIKKKSTNTLSEDYIYFMAGYGRHQTFITSTQTISNEVLGIQVTYFKQVVNIFRLGYGIDLNYWQYYRKYLGANTIESTSLGFIVQPEIIVGHITICTGIGLYLKNYVHKDLQTLYERFGLKYNFYDDLYIGIGMRTVQAIVPEFLEFSVGYKLPLMSPK